MVAFFIIAVERYAMKNCLYTTDQNEVEGVFTWFQNEMGVDKAVPGKLWDGNVLTREIMDALV